MTWPMVFCNVLKSGCCGSAGCPAPAPPPGCTACGLWTVLGAGAGVGVITDCCMARPGAALLLLAAVDTGLG